MSLEHGGWTPERRRSARVSMPRTEVAMLPAAENVQVLDISVIGVLLHSSRRVALGTRGSLRLNLAGAPFSAEVEIRRVSPAGINPGDSGSGYRIGATFIGITPDHRQLIERFASQ